MTSVAVPAAAYAATTRAAAPDVHCVSADRDYKTLAKKLARDLDDRIAPTGLDTGLNLTDSRTKVTCWYRSTRHFIAASVIKVTILAALLRKAQEQHRTLTASEMQAATLMITQSDNAAANRLWFDVGIPSVQHFLDLAKMRQTVLDYHWGLTQITAHDEMLLLSLLSGPNRVLTNGSRAYELNLMAQVIASQRWGVPAGAPRSVTVHVKNGWLPYPGSLWEVNSLGTFTTKTRTYLIAMLTYGSSPMAYGVAAIQSAAMAIHARLNPGKHPTVPPAVPGPSWGIPDETVPGR